jgi:hypothetical protein
VAFIAAVLCCGPARSPAANRKPGKQHDRDAQRQRDAEVVVEPEAAQQEGQQRQDHRAGRPGDRLADPGEGADDRLVLACTCAQFLAEPVDEEQAVVGADTEHQHGQQRLRHRGDLQAVRAEPGDELLRYQQCHHGGHEHDHGQPAESAARSAAAR